MTTKKELGKWISDKIKKHPEVKSEILDYYQLCLDEIDEGGSTQHEINLCVSSIEELILEKN